MTIYIIRHGETALNAARILQPTDTPLSHDGVMQAYALAKRLKAISIDAILCSDLPRAMQTAHAIAALQAKLSPSCFITSEHLRERDLGDLRGKPYDAIGVDILNLTEAPPGGESMAQFNARVALAFAQIISLQQRYETLVVVTHGLVIREITKNYLSLRPGIDAPTRIGNTAVTIFESMPPHWVDVLNSTEHLETL